MATTYSTSVFLCYFSVNFLQIYTLIQYEIIYLHTVTVITYTIVTFVPQLQCRKDYELLLVFYVFVFCLYNFQISKLIISCNYNTNVPLVPTPVHRVFGNSNM